MISPVYCDFCQNLQSWPNVVVTLDKMPSGDKLFLGGRSLFNFPTPTHQSNVGIVRININILSRVGKVGGQKDHVSDKSATESVPRLEQYFRSNNHIWPGIPSAYNQMKFPCCSSHTESCFEKRPTKAKATALKEIYGYWYCTVALLKLKVFQGG